MTISLGDIIETSFRRWEVALPDSGSVVYDGGGLIECPRRRLSPLAMFLPLIPPRWES